jgi:hypothetical protein
MGQVVGASTGSLSDERGRSSRSIARVERGAFEEPTLSKTQPFEALTNRAPDRSKTHRTGIGP